MITPDKCPYCGADWKTSPLKCYNYKDLTIAWNTRRLSCYERQIERLTEERDELQKEVARLNDTPFSLSP